MERQIKTLDIDPKLKLCKLEMYRSLLTGLLVYSLLIIFMGVTTNVYAFLIKLGAIKINIPSILFYIIGFWVMGFVWTFNREGNFMVGIPKWLSLLLFFSIKKKKIMIQSIILQIVHYIIIFSFLIELNFLGYLLLSNEQFKTIYLIILSVLFLPELIIEIKKKIK